MRLYIAEVLEKIKTLSSDEEKVKFLRANSSSQLQTYIFANFNPNIIFLLPETNTPFKVNPAAITLAESNLYKECRKLYLFYKGGAPNLHQARREQLWIQLLEGLAKPEALLMESLKNKAFEKDYGLTRELVDAAFPTLLTKIPKTNPQIKEQEEPKTEATPKKKRGRKPRASKAEAEPQPKES